MNALTITNQGALRTLTLSRPDVRNAFNDEVIAELKTAFIEAGLAADVRCVLLAAEGPAFCAGADLNWMRAMADYSWAQNHADAAWRRAVETWLQQNEIIAISEPKSVTQFP